MAVYVILFLTKKVIYGVLRGPYGQILEEKRKKRKTWRSVKCYRIFQGKFLKFLNL